MNPPSANRGSVATARSFVDAFLGGDSFDAVALEGARDFDFSDGTCRCRFPVARHAQNRYGALHGGCAATLVDVVSTAALLTVCGDPGVSASLNVIYASPGPGGTDVDVEARVLKHGRSLAFLEVSIWTRGGDGEGKGKDADAAADRKLVAKGSHVKFLPGTGVGMAPGAFSGGAGARAKL